MVDDLVFCFLNVFCMCITIIWYAHLNMENKRYSGFVMVLEFIGLIAISYFLLLIYKIFSGN